MTLKRRGLTAEGSLCAWLACLVIGLGLPGCAIGGPQMAPGVQFSLDAVDAGAAPATALRAVRLHGWASVPAGIQGLANVQNGKVSGSPVVVTSATTGRLLARGVTYYDGSFLVDVPMGGSQVAAVVAIDLVDRTDETRTARLEAPVMLHAGVDDAEVNLGPGSTALVQFLSQVATAPAGNSAEEAPGLGDLIATFAPADQQQFAKLAEASPEIQKVSTLMTFQTGIQAYVGRLTGRLGGRKAAGGASQVATNRL